MLKYALLYLFK